MHEGFGCYAFRVKGQVVGYSHNGDWGWFNGNRSGHATSYLVHFIDGVDAALLVNSDQAGDYRGLFAKGWSLEQSLR